MAASLAHAFSTSEAAESHAAVHASSAMPVSSAGTLMPSPPPPRTATRVRTPALWPRSWRAGEAAHGVAVLRWAHRPQRADGGGGPRLVPGGGSVVVGYATGQGGPAQARAGPPRADATRC